MVTNDAFSDQFPAGLRVLVVDDDPTCLIILEKMLKSCQYEVTKCSRAEVALELLRDNKDGFDVVISDVHMPDMDGFRLLEQIGLEMDLPVIMMSVDDSKNVVMKGVTHGACDYLIKPVRIEVLRTIWQHVVRKRKHEYKDKDFEQLGSVEDGELHQKPSEEANEGNCKKPSEEANEGNCKGSKKRKDEEDDSKERDDQSTLKKQRVVWSIDLHQQFVTAVNHLGIDNAVPKKILELMNVPGITRENVASHLQKYRFYLRRLSRQHPNGLENSFMGPQDAPFGSMTSYNGLASSNQLAPQLPPQSLATIQAAVLNRAANKAATAVSMPLLYYMAKNENGEHARPLYKSSPPPFKLTHSIQIPNSLQNNSQKKLWSRNLQLPNPPAAGAAEVLELAGNESDNSEAYSVGGEE